MAEVAAQVAHLEEILARHRAFWERTPVDRPLLTVSRAFRDVRSDWLTPDLLEPRAFAENARLGPGSPLLSDDFFRAIHPQNNVPWMEAIVGSPIYVEDVVDGMWPRPRPFEWADVASARAGSDNPWVAKLLEFTRELVARWDGTYLVSHTLMRGPIYMASAILGDMRLNFAFHDCPAELGELLAACADTFIQVGHAQQALIPPFHGGYCSWYGIWALGWAQRTQADSASQISAKTYREHVLPHDRRIMEAFEYSSIDLHSGGTLHLSGDLIQEPALHAISVSIDPYESQPRIAKMLPTFARILERKSLVLWGKMKESELRLLLDNLPPTGLAIRATIVE